jgi:hypothetical protein
MLQQHQLPPAPLQADPLDNTSCAIPEALSNLARSPLISQKTTITEGTLRLLAESVLELQG